MRLLFAHLPAYATDTDAQRCEWLNTAVARLWTYTAPATADLVSGPVLQPILDQVPLRLGLSTPPSPASMCNLYVHQPGTASAC